MLKHEPVGLVKGLMHYLDSSDYAPQQVSEIEEGLLALHHYHNKYDRH